MFGVERVMMCVFTYADTGHQLIRIYILTCVSPLLCDFQSQHVYIPSQTKLNDSLNPSFPFISDIHLIIIITAIAKRKSVYGI